jgi:hypothetical protein
MTDYTDLIARLRSWRLPAADKAADALEAQARRIAELEAGVQAIIDDFNLLCEAKDARIAELEAALKAVVDDATGYKHPGLNVRQVSFDAIDAARAAYRGEKE